MGSKRWKGKTCVYCAVPESSEDPDHVVARGFFPLDKRDNLPQVPSCKPCNNLKSRIEIDLQASIPLASRVDGAKKFAEEMVAPRLRKNQRLARHLNKGAKFEYANIDGQSTPSFTIPFDHDSAVALYKMIAKGLAFHHWGVVIPDADVMVEAGFLTPFGVSTIERVFTTTNCNSTGVVELGDRVFTYLGTQDRENPTLTVWRFAMYDSVVSAEDEAGSEVISSNAYVITAPRTINEVCDLAMRVGGKS